MAESPDKHRPSAPSSACGLKPNQWVGKERYRLKRLIGVGGMGEVWQAYDTRLHEFVALKFLLKEFAGDTGALERVRRETLRSRHLSHPHIVRIYDLYEEAGELPFISMEYVDGASLHYVRQSHPNKVFRWDFLSPLVKQLISAIVYAHGEGIVHCDIKPANLLLNRQGRIKLADFGIARVLWQIKYAQTKGGFAGGTIDYISPQQADGELPTQADDIYSLGATLYELLTGTPPFYNGDIEYQLRHTKPEPMSQRLLELGIANDIPQTLEEFIQVCLSKNPQLRPAKAAELFQWISRIDEEFQKEFGGAAGVAAAQIAAEKVQKVEGEVFDAEKPGDMEEGEVAAGATKPTQVIPVFISTKPVEESAQEVERKAVGFSLQTRLSVVIALGIAAILVVYAGFKIQENVSAKLREQENRKKVIATKPQTVGFTEKINLSEYIKLFDGNSLDGWEGDNRFWFVENGEIVGRFASAITNLASPFTVLFYRGRIVENFELRLLFKCTGGIYDVFYRADEFPDYTAGGYTCRITAWSTGQVQETFPDGNGRLLQLKAPATREEALRRDYILRSAMRAGEWNELVITAIHRRLQHKLNGVVVRDTIDYQKSRKKGLIGIGMHYIGSSFHSELRIKDIRLKILPEFIGKDEQTAFSLIQSNAVAINTVTTTAAVTQAPAEGTKTNVVERKFTLLRQLPMSVLSIAGRQGEFWVVAGCADGNVYLIDNRDGNIIWQAGAHKGAVRSVAVSPTGREIASGGDDWVIRGWLVAGGNNIFEWRGHSAAITWLAFGQNRYLASADEIGTIKLWDVIGGRFLTDIRGRGNKISSLGFSYDLSRLASTDNAGEVNVWAVPSGRGILSFTGHNGDISGLCFSQLNNYFYTAGADGFVRMWDTSVFKPVNQIQLRGVNTAIVGFALASDETILAVATRRGDVYLYNPTTFAKLGVELPAINSKINSIIFDGKNSRIIVGCDDGGIYYFDIR